MKEAIYGLMVHTHCCGNDFLIDSLIFGGDSISFPPKSAGKLELLPKLGRKSNRASARSVLHAKLESFPLENHESQSICQTAA